MPLTPAQDAALALIEKLVEVLPRYHAVNDELKALAGDFYSHLAPVADCIETPMAALLDAVLGADGLASYFLYESPKGGRWIQEADGRRWPLDTAPELRAYLEHLAG